MFIPALYDLSFVRDRGSMAIVVEVHNDIIRNTPIIDATSDVVTDYTYFGLGPSDTLRGDLRSKEFGFGGALKKTSSDGTYSRFSSFLPPLEQRAKLVLLAKSLSLLFKVSEYFYISGQKTSSNQSQLMLLHTEVRSDQVMEGWTISGDFNSPLYDWLKELSLSSQKDFIEIPSVAIAMQAAKDLLFGKSPSPVTICSAGVKGRGDLIINDGQAGIKRNPMLRSFMDFENGYMICSDNMDDVVTQIILLVALCRIYELARVAGVGNYLP